MTDTALLTEINEHIWGPFKASYAAGDAGAFMALHTPDLIRAGGPRRTAEDHEQTAAAMADFLQMVRDRGDKLAIDFAFTERIAGPAIASERGLFQITIQLADGTTRVRYGRFHTFHRCTDGRWRIAVDYDSPVEDEEAGAAEYAAATPIDDVAPYA